MFHPRLPRSTEPARSSSAVGIREIGTVGDVGRSRRRTARHTGRLRRFGAAALVALATTVVLGRLPILRDRSPTGTVAVVASTRAIGAGQVLIASDVTIVEVPAERRPEHAITDPAAVTGRAAIAPIERGEMLTATRLVGDAALRGVTDGGRVVIAVPVIDPEVLGYAPAGTRVDLLGGNGTPSARGALVLATPAPSTTGGSLIGQGLSGARPESRSVLLAVTAAEALVIAGELTSSATGPATPVSGYLLAVRPT